MEKKRHNKMNIVFVMSFYWLAIILWQWIRPVANRSLLDTIVKVGVFVFVLVFASKYGNFGFTFVAGSCLLLFIVTQAATLLIDQGNITSATIITVAFMIIQIIVFLFLLRNETISKNYLIKFCYFIYILAVIMAVYNVVFHSNRFFLTFASGGGAYGSECKSFLYSNHEFGVYLSIGIISSIWLLINKKLNILLFIISIAFLFANLMSTYSRTAILGLLLALFFVLFFASTKAFVVYSVSIAAALIVILNNSTLYSIFIGKLMKGSFEQGALFDQGRATQYAGEWDSFQNASFFNKLFGYGYTMTGGEGGHNAYLTILNTGGIIMFSFFAFVIILGIYYSVKTIKVEKRTGGLMLGFVAFTLMYMVAQTPILFYSTMDSFFITMVAVLIPKYVYNHYYMEKEASENANSTS